MRRESSIRKVIIYPLSLILILSMLSSCKKRVFEGTPGTVLLFNAMNDGVNVITNLSGTSNFRYNAALNVFNKQFNTVDKINIRQSPQPLALYAYPDTLSTNAPVMNLSLDVKQGEIFSLFLFGEKKTAQYLLHKDIIPSGSTLDSLTFIRFINLSEGQNVKINFRDNTPGSLVNNLVFKQVSEFIPLSANKSVSEYVFEVRDSQTDNLLASYTASDIMWLQYKPTGG